MDKDDANQPLDKTMCTIDKAKELAGIGKFQYIILALAGFALTCVSLENQSMSLVLPMAKCDLNISLSEQGFINSVVFIGILLSSHFWGFITDTWGRIRTLRCTLMLSFFASALSSMSTHTWMLIITRLIVGLTMSGVKISATAYAGEFFDNSHRPKYFILLISIAGLSFIILPLLGMAFLTLTFEFIWFSNFVYKPWRLFIFVIGLMTGLTSVALFFLPEGPSFSMAVGNKQYALNTLETIYNFNTGRPKKDYGVTEICETDEGASNLKSVKNFKQALSLIWNQTWPLFSKKYRVDMIVLCVLMFFALGFTQALNIWYPQILLFFEGNESLSITTCEAVLLASESKSSLIDPLNNATILSNQGECNATFDMSTLNIIIIRGVVLIVMNLIAGILISYIGKTTVIATWFALISIAAIGLIWANNQYAIIVLMITVLSSSAVTNSYLAISSDLFETKFKGMVISLVVMSGRTGTIVCSNLFGAFLYTSCSSLIITIAVAMLFCTCAAYYLLRKADKIDAINVESKL